MNNTVYPVQCTASNGNPKPVLTARIVDGKQLGFRQRELEFNEAQIGNYFVLNGVLILQYFEVISNDYI